MAAALQYVKMAAIQSSRSEEVWSTQDLKCDGIGVNVGSGQEPQSGAAEYGPELQERQEHKM